MTPADVVLLTGPPGAGKTTVGRALAARHSRGVHLHTDDFWHAIVAGGIAPFLPESDAQNQTVLDVIRAAAWAYSDGGYTTVVDGIIGPWMLPRFRGAAGRRVHYVVLRPSRAEALARATARTAPDALVDEGPIVGLWEQFADLGALERHAIDTTAQSPAETLDAVAAAVAGGEFLLA